MDISNDNSKCYYSRTKILFKKGTVIKKVHLDMGNLSKLSKLVWEFRKQTMIVWNIVKKTTHAKKVGHSSEYPFGNY